ncbi:magnesium transporter [Aeromicrobium sp. CTD01-1L150]|uniref:magnesium transporter n=1 Tax=Aeromicrobium sp. CTD01-1L150 TaxID=3341830 RepID=UPI0035BF1777
MQTPHDREAVLDALADQDLPRLADLVGLLDGDALVELLERLDTGRRAVLFRVLTKSAALEVFERLDPALQAEIVEGLRDEQVASVFAELDPDDRVGLLDELPATVAHRLMRGLSQHERDLTATVLGYPSGSIGRRMSPEFVSVGVGADVAEAMERVRRAGPEVDSTHTVVVVDAGRQVVSVVGLPRLVAADPAERVLDLTHEVRTARADENAEDVARRCVGSKALALPVVDAENRLVGLLTVDDALRVLEDADSEDQARIGGTEPLRRPYLSTPIRSIVRSRLTWLFVLAIGATLTVQVLEVFESTLEELVVLSMFIPLLIGTGGNTGNQAATTVTRAIALGDVAPREVGTVVLRELRVGLSLGVLLGAAGYVFTALVYDSTIGLVVGLTLASICTMAAAVGGAMPLLARTLGVDPAVFSNPFISTFVDATGLVVYFLIARAVLGL